MEAVGQLRTTTEEAIGGAEEQGVEAVKITISAAATVETTEAGDSVEAGTKIPPTTVLRTKSFQDLAEAPTSSINPDL